MTYTNKYYVAVKGIKQQGDGLPGRYPDPDAWISGPDPIAHDKYYGWKKHQAQASFRNEDYSLTWEDWQLLWPDDVWLRRGRTSDSLTMYRRDHSEGWQMDNVVICRVCDKGQYYQKDRTPGGRTAGGNV